MLCKVPLNLLFPCWCSPCHVFVLLQFCCCVTLRHGLLGTDTGTFIVTLSPSCSGNLGLSYQWYTDTRIRGLGWSSEAIHWIYTTSAHLTGSNLCIHHKQLGSNNCTLRGGRSLFIRVSLVCLSGTSRLFFGDPLLDRAVDIKIGLTRRSYLNFPVDRSIIQQTGQH